MKIEDSLTYPYANPPILRSRPIAILAVALSYILLFKFSFLNTFISESVSPVFLPAGLALAATLIMGRKALIGIGLGSFISNAFLEHGLPSHSSTDLLSHLPTDFCIALSSVLASFVTARLVKKACGDKNILGNGKSILFLLFAAPVSFCSITASISVSSLYINGVIQPELFWYAYKTWWFGDAIGIILITPFFLSWAQKDSFKRENFKFIEMTLHGIITIALCITIFFKYHELKYLLLPILFWSSYRFPIQITTFVIFIVALMALFSTLRGIGPFNEETVNDSIFFLNLFLSTISICSLFLSGIIKERNRAELEIKTSETNLRKNQLLLQSTLESPRNFKIYSISREYEYLSFNTQYRLNIKELYGVDLELRMNIKDAILDPLELKITKNTLERAFSGEDVTNTRYFKARDRYLEFRTSPIRNTEDEIIGATVIATNITQKIRDEEALKKSEEKYRNIFENVQDVIFQTDINGIFEEISPSVLEFCGYTAEELIGKPTHILRAAEENRESIIKMINENSTIRYYETVIKTKSGATKNVALSAKMIYEIKEKRHHITFSARDITERKEQERKIALQNEQLQIQNKELEQFAYITSHDLQEPLITLKFFSELIKNESSLKDIDSELRQYLDFILESSDRMQKLVKGLLDYSRIGTDIKQEDIDCNQLLQEAIEGLAEEIKQAHCEISAEILPRLNGSPYEIRVLFEQLLSNSIKFRKKEVPLRIKIDAIKNTNYWHFKFEDNGIGMEQQNTEKAFIIFRRLNNRGEYPGIGIGLAISKKIIALHTGKIWIESVIGAGCTVHFTIPLKTLTPINNLNELTT